MNIYPILLDTRPPYLDAGEAASSLLLLPAVGGTLLQHLRARVAEVTAAPPVVFTAFEPSPAYRAAIQRADPAILGVFGPTSLASHLDTCEPSDGLLVVDPACLPASGLDLRALFDDGGDPRWARHLVALDFSADGTRERVEFDRNGRVRRIQRFYDGVTWPFTAGVCGSLLPGSCARLAGDLPWTSLAAIREALAHHGIAGRDVPLETAALDLTEERGALAAGERLVTEALAERGRSGRHSVLYTGTRQQVHRSARLLGPIVIHADAVIEEDATVLGPALIGEGARVGRGAIVAQSVLGRGTTVPAGASLRHRVLVGDFGALGDDRPEAPGVTVESGEGPLREGSPSGYARCKPLLDAAGALCTLVLLSPLLLLIALLIRLESPGPVLYGQRREGKDGRVFRCWKFRTMHDGAERRERDLQARNQVDGPQFKLEHDPRTTRVGRWLRPMSLDELPQLLNVARGEMSFVGPRPSPFRENQLCVPWRDGRLSVRPGITGLWQVCRHDRRAGDFHQWIHYDLLYVRNLCWRLDLNILAATVLTLGGKGHVSLSWVMPAHRLQEEA